MKAEIFAEKILGTGIQTITGIPDSTLKQFCEYLDGEGSNLFRRHIVPENEGAAVGIAVGEYLSAGIPACVYMQNSGLGNTINPITSIANNEVYGIPMLLMIGWRGEPGTKDEPQHKFMGRITEKLLDVLEIPYAVVGKESTEDELEKIFAEAKKSFSLNQQFAVLVKKGTFDSEREVIHKNSNKLVRERAVEKIAGWMREDDIIVSTTGKISREMYEQSEKIRGNHCQTFLTVGGMGHANMIAYGIAKRKKDKRVVCMDGDGALLMHMGGLAVIGKNPLENFIHICLDNESHESVGGMETGAAGINYGEIAKACGYKQVFYAETEAGLEQALQEARECKEMVFIEVKVAIGSREDLPRPKEKAAENKMKFMEYHGVDL